MSGPLCDEVLEESGSAAILESLRTLQPVRSTAGRQRGVVPLPPSFPGAAAFGPGPSRAGSRTFAARSCNRWCEANGEPETAIGYAQEAGDVDRVAQLVERCALSAYLSGRVATSERWLGWLEHHGALERNALVAVIGGVIATAQGRPEQAERFADAAEHAYDRTLPDGSPTTLAWLCILRAQRCPRGVARMRADAELALRTPARGRRFRSHAMVLLGVSHWLAGEVDQADDLFADAVEEGLELGAHEVAAVALGERAAVAIGQGRWVEAEEFAERALRVAHRSRLDEYPTSAFVCALAARVALHRGEAQRAHELLTRAQRLRAGLTYAIAAAGRPVSLGACPRLPGDGRRRRRRDDAARDRGPVAPTARPRHASLRSGRAAREPEDDARRRPRRLDPDRGGATPAPLPHHAPHLPRDRRAPLRIAQHGQITGDGRLPQAQRQLPQRRGRTRPRARTGLSQRPALGGISCNLRDDVAAPRV